MVMGAIIWLLMGHQGCELFLFVLGVLLVSSIALCRSPCIFRQARVRWYRIPCCWRANIRRSSTIVAALLAYRVLYYLSLLLALVCYLIPRPGEEAAGEKRAAMAK